MRFPKTMTTAEMCEFLLALADGRQSLYAVDTKEKLKVIAIHLRVISNVCYRLMDETSKSAPS